MSGTRSAARRTSTSSAFSWTMSRSRASRARSGGREPWGTWPGARPARRSVTINVPDGAHTLYVWYAVSSEEDFDFFRILVDDVEVASFSGEIGWTRAVVNVAGASTVAFQYDKDDSFSEGNDTAWIDDLLFVGAISDTLTVTDWTAPRTLVDPVCD